MSSQAPERAARLTSKHLLETWSAKTGGQSPATALSLPNLPSDVPVGKGVVLARACGYEVNTNGSVTTLDGVTLQVGDVIFCPVQLSSVDNGLWVVQPDAAAWIRMQGALEDWMVVVVTDGTFHIGEMWVYNAGADAVVGVDDLTWMRITDEQDLTDHIMTMATTSVQGHVMIDDVTIKMSGNQIHTALSASGSAGKVATWSGANTIGYASAVNVAHTDGEIYIQTSARDGLYVLQEGNHKAVRITRSGAGAASTPAVTIEALDATDGTDTLLITKAGQGTCLSPVHLAHGEALGALTVGDGTSTIVPAVSIEAQSNFTPAAGFGVRQNFILQSSTTVNQNAGAISAEWVVATHTSRKARLKLLVSDATTEREGMRMEADGTAVKLGFFGAAAVVKPTALTAIDNSTVDTTYGAQERDVITNTRTRLSELETKLKNLGLLS